MKVEVTNSGPCERTLSVVIDPEMVKSEREKVIDGFKKEAKIKGFRPGKAPKSLIVSRFADSIKEETLHQVISEGVRQALEQEKIQPLTHPTIDKFDLAADDTLSFVARVEIFPEIKLERYKSLKVEKKVHKVSGEDVDRTLENLREQQASFVPKEGAAEKGEYLLMNFTVLDEQGKAGPGGTRENQLVMAGHEDPTALFSHRLVGLGEGADQKLEIDFPEDYPEESLKGRKVGYKLNVKGVRKKVLPELDDNFASQVSVAENLEGLRDLLRRNMEAEIGRRAEREVEEDLFRQIVVANPFDLPPSLVEETLMRQVEDFRKQNQGRQFEPEELARIMRPMAEFGLKREFIVHELTHLEKLEVADEEIEAKLEEYAGQLGKPVEEVRMDFRSKKAMNHLRAMLQEEKVVKFLLANNEIETVES